MGKLVVTEFVSLDGVMEDPGGAEGYRHGGWTFKFDRGAEGDRFKLDELMAADAAAPRPTNVRGLRQGVAVDRGRSRIRRQDELDAQVRRLEDARVGGLEQLDGAVRRPGRRRRRAEATVLRRHPRGRQRAARAGPPAARPRRRAAADGLPGDARNAASGCSRTAPISGASSSSRRPSREPSRSSRSGERPRSAPTVEPTASVPVRSLSASYCRCGPLQARRCFGRA